MGHSDSIAQPYGKTDAAKTPNRAFERTRGKRSWCAFNAVVCVRPVARATQRKR